MTMPGPGPEYQMALGHRQQPLGTKKKSGGLWSGLKQMFHSSGRRQMSSLSHSCLGQTVGQEEAEMYGQGGHVGLSRALSMSHESVFQMEPVAGQDAVSDPVSQVRTGSTLVGGGAGSKLVHEELQAVLKQRQTRTRCNSKQSNDFTDDEDLGLPKSLQNSPGDFSDDQCESGRGLLSRGGGGHWGNSRHHSSCSDNSLLSLDSWEGGRGVSRDHSLSPSSFSPPPRGDGRLSHMAARHKMAIRPRRNHAVRQHRRLQQLEEVQEVGLGTEDEGMSVSQILEVPDSGNETGFEQKKVKSKSLDISFRSGTPPSASVLQDMSREEEGVVRGGKVEQESSFLLRLFGSKRHKMRTSTSKKLGEPKPSKLKSGLRSRALDEFTPPAADVEAGMSQRATYYHCPDITPTINTSSRARPSMKSKPPPPPPASPPNPSQRLSKSQSFRQDPLPMMASHEPADPEYPVDFPSLPVQPLIHSQDVILKKNKSIGSSLNDEASHQRFRSSIENWSFANEGLKKSIGSLADSMPISSLTQSSESLKSISSLLDEPDMLEREEEQEMINSNLELGRITPPKSFLVRKDVYNDNQRLDMNNDNSLEIVEKNNDALTSANFVDNKELLSMSREGEELILNSAKNLQNEIDKDLLKNNYHNDSSAFQLFSKEHRQNETTPPAFSPHYQEEEVEKINKLAVSAEVNDIVENQDNDSGGSPEQSDTVPHVDLLQVNMEMLSEVSHKSLDQMAELGEPLKQQWLPLHTCHKEQTNQVDMEKKLQLDDQQRLIMSDDVERICQQKEEKPFLIRTDPTFNELEDTKQIYLLVDLMENEKSPQQSERGESQNKEIIDAQADNSCTFHKDIEGGPNVLQKSEVQIDQKPQESVSEKKNLCNNSTTDQGHQKQEQKDQQSIDIFCNLDDSPQTSGMHIILLDKHFTKENCAYKSDEQPIKLDNLNEKINPDVLSNHEEEEAKQEAEPDIKTDVESPITPSSTTGTEMLTEVKKPEISPKPVPAPRHFFLRKPSTCQVPSNEVNETQQEELVNAWARRSQSSSVLGRLEHNNDEVVQISEGDSEKNISPGNDIIINVKERAKSFSGIQNHTFGPKPFRPSSIAHEIRMTKPVNIPPKPKLATKPIPAPRQFRSISSSDVTKDKAAGGLSKITKSASSIKYSEQNPLETETKRIVAAGQSSETSGIKTTSNSMPTDGETDRNARRPDLSKEKTVENNNLSQMADKSNLEEIQVKKIVKSFQESKSPEKPVRKFSSPKSRDRILIEQEKFDPPPISQPSEVVDTSHNVMSIVTKLNAMSTTSTSEVAQQ